MNEETKEKIRQRAKERWSNQEWKERELQNRSNQVDDYKARGEKLSKTLREKNKGKWCIASGGYKILLGESNGGILEHRKMMEEKLGRKLLPNEIVHHKDENKLHNEYENFELTIRSKHIPEKHGYSEERNRKISESKKNPVFAKRIPELLSEGCSTIRICKLIGCSKRTVSRYRELLNPKTRGV
jgi:hypothetical protein